MLLHSHTQLQGEFVNKLRLTRTVRQLSADHLFTTTPFHRHFPLFHYTHYFKKFTPSLQVCSVNRMNDICINRIIKQLKILLSLFILYLMYNI